MAYEPPPFMPYEPFLLGVGVVFNLLRNVSSTEMPQVGAPKQGGVHQGWLSTNSSRGSRGFSDMLELAVGRSGIQKKKHHSISWWFLEVFQCESEPPLSKPPVAALQGGALLQFRLEFGSFRVAER